ncbi:MAG: hypothetical protein ACRD0F_05660, partial [Acidimicrobiales bacterium]
RAVLDTLGWEPTSTEQVLERTGLAPPAAASLLSRLEIAGLVTGGTGWWQRCR